MTSRVYPRVRGHSGVMKINTFDLSYGVRAVIVRILVRAYNYM
jgi:hypothetical protein